MKKISQLLIGLAVLLAAAQAGVQITPAGGIGPQGPAGTNGAAATVAVTNAVTGAPGSAASATNLGTSSAANLQFTIPAGSNGVAGANGLPGSNGLAGAAATVAVTNAVTGAPGSAASVTNLGTSGAANLQFTIPAGSNGVNGVISNAVLLALSLGDGYGLSSNIASSAIVWPAPAAAFTVPGSAAVGVAVTFTNLSTQALLGSITNSIWDFGDGNSLTSMSTIVSNTYAAAGTDTVSLTVWNSFGSTNSISTNLIVTAETFALQFDGSQNWIDVPSIFAAAPAGLTMEVSVRGLDADNTGAAFLIDWSDISTFSTFIELVAGVPSGYVTTDAGNPTLAGSVSILDGAWHTVRMTWDGATEYLFVDGNLVSSASLGGNLLVAGGSIYINGQDGGPMLNGAMAEVMVSSAARSTTNYVSSFCLTNDANTVAYWKLNDGSDTNAVDSSGNGFDGTFIGSPPPAWTPTGVCP